MQRYFLQHSFSTNNKTPFSVFGYIWRHCAYFLLHSGFSANNLLVFVSDVDQWKLVL